jgi:cytochrome bd-type quinol oxidase subunit 1
MTAELIHRLHFAFTITFHYLFLSSPWAWRF